jgi:hypothetical protein
LYIKFDIVNILCAYTFMTEVATLGVSSNSSPSLLLCLCLCLCCNWNLSYPPARAQRIIRDLGFGGEDEGTAPIDRAWRIEATFSKQTWKTLARHFFEECARKARSPPAGKTRYLPFYLFSTYSCLIH